MKKGREYDIDERDVLNKTLNNLDVSSLLLKYDKERNKVNCKLNKQIGMSEMK